MSDANLRSAAELALTALRATRNDLSQRGRQNTPLWGLCTGAIRALRKEVEVSHSGKAQPVPMGESQ